jgi:hypothetical protein
MRGEACPFIELGDPDCSRHFTLTRLTDAFGVCFGNFRHCPNFYRLLHDHPNRLVTLSVHGRKHSTMPGRSLKTGT